ncbi:Serine/threonine-protein phosphatase 7 long form-like protein [Senna tora]|uniref:Serine/threonine-protein phosphatase 7 long form-like protein n=1 Tax=Senna tora TaxID=362788 RepID=A0A834SMQ9_9FABA|nr:Serine/threonine-protein phosphatase 7 long form-like protein [Senna tora]
MLVVLVHLLGSQPGKLSSRSPSLRLHHGVHFGLEHAFGLLGTNPSMLDAGEGNCQGNPGPPHGHLHKDKKEAARDCPFPTGLGLDVDLFGGELAALRLHSGFGMVASHPIAQSPTASLSVHGVAGSSQIQERAIEIDVDSAFVPLIPCLFIPVSQTHIMHDREVAQRSWNRLGRAIVKIPYHLQQGPIEVGKCLLGGHGEVASMVLILGICPKPKHAIVTDNWWMSCRASSILRANAISTAVCITACTPRGNFGRVYAGSGISTNSLIVVAPSSSVVVGEVQRPAIPCTAHASVCTRPVGSGKYASRDATSRRVHE